MPPETLSRGISYIIPCRRIYSRSESLNRNSLLLDANRAYSITIVVLLVLLVIVKPEGRPEEKIFTYSIKAPLAI